MTGSDASRTAFVVDDEPEVVRAVSRALVVIGYEVVGATGDARAALALIPEVAPDVVVMDVDLRQALSGIDVAVHLRATCDVPVVLLTGVGAPDLDLLHDHDGVIGYVSKPFTLTTLRTTIALVRVQHRSRRRLRELDRRYRALFEQAAVGVAQLDATTGAVVAANQKCAAILGCTIDELVGMELADWVEPGQRGELRTAIGRLGRRELREHGDELRCRRPDGGLFWIRVDVAPLATDDVRGHHVVIVQDVTDRHLAEDVLARHRALLSASVEASRAKTDFLAHMSHELRTPLNAVLGLSEALLEHTFGPLNDAQADTLATIHDSGRHLLELINDVLDIARVESGKLPIEPEQVLLRPLIDESTALVYGQLTLKGQRLVIELEPGLPPVDVDKRRIKQVLLNLLGNAIKFSPPGAVVTLRAGNQPEARQILLSVADTGPGIAPADQQRIFEPFVTLAPAMTREHAGAGLGLALVKRIIELHHGKVRIDSEPGAGSRFTVTLPVSSAYAGETPPAPALRPAPRGTPAPEQGAPVVLLAEDNAANVKTLRGYLEGRGYRVRVVRDGRAAVDAAAGPEVAIVLMDIQLAGLDGLEATRRIRAGGPGAGKPIIALTAYAMPGDEARCLDAGASAYLAKPVRLRELTDTIDRLLAGAEPGR